MRRFVLKSAAALLVCLLLPGPVMGWESKGKRGEWKAADVRREVFALLSENQKSVYPNLSAFKEIDLLIPEIDDRVIGEVLETTLTKFKAGLKQTNGNNILDEFTRYMKMTHSQNDPAARAVAELRLYSFIDVYLEDLRNSVPFGKYRRYLEIFAGTDFAKATVEAQEFYKAQCPAGTDCHEKLKNVNWTDAFLAPNGPSAENISSAPKPPPICGSGDAGYMLNETPAYILYHPACLEPGRRYPMLICLTPNASGEWSVFVWNKAAKRRKWIVYASKTFAVGLDMEESFKPIVANVNEIASGFPIDTDRIAVWGVSGGAMGAHAIAFGHPDLIRAVIANTGMMHPYFIEHKAQYPRDKWAVFLANPQDIRYKEMKRDRAFLESVGWKVQWTEFEGQTLLAPRKRYEESLKWIEEN